MAGGEGYVGGGVGSELFRLGFCEFKIPGFNEENAGGLADWNICFLGLGEKNFLDFSSSSIRWLMSWGLP